MQEIDQDIPDDATPEEIAAEQFGAPGANDDVIMPMVLALDPLGAPPPVAPTMPIDWQIIANFYTACISSDPRVTYHLGSKIPSDTAVPGVDFTHVDCSGFVRACIRRSTHPQVLFPDGSVVQHDWVAASRYATSSVADGLLVDGKIRIAFLAPGAAPGHSVGHVVLIHNGYTVESHGSTGPDRRQWTGADWQHYTSVFVLAG